MLVQDFKNILLFLIFLIPFTLLIFDPAVLFPYITTKALIFRVLVTLSLPFLFYILLLDKKPFQKIKNYLLLACFFYFLVYSLSGFLGLNPYRSFWGNAERMEGIWSLFFYFLYFFILYLLFSYDPKLKKIIFWSFALVSFLISILEIYQYFTLGALRPSATLGNPTYIGFFNLLMFFLLLYFYFETKDKLEKPIFIFLALLNLFSLFTSETRGSILGLLAGLFIFGFYYAIFSQKELKNRIKIISLFLVAIIAFVLILLSPISAFLPGINRLSETLRNPVSVFPRLFAWKIFFDGFKSSPLIGYGPETEPIVFFKFFDPKIYEYEAAIFDRPHNKFVQILVNSGILGMISWLSIFIAFFYYLFQNKEMNSLQKASLSGFIFAYLVQNFSLFDMQASYLVFFFGLSLVIPKLEFKFDEEKFIRPYLILVGGLSLIFLTFHFSHYYILSSLIKTSKMTDYNKAAEEFERLSEIAGPFLTEEAIHLVHPYFFKVIESGDKSALESIFRLYEVIKKAYKKEPLDQRLITKSSSLDLYLANLFLVNNLPKYNDYLTSFQETIEKSIEFYPKNYELIIFYAQNLVFLEKNYPKKFNFKDKVINLVVSREKYFENFPPYFLNEAKIISFYDKDLAKEKLKLAIKKGLNLKKEQYVSTILDVLSEIKDKEILIQVVKIVEKEKFSTQTQEKIEKIKLEFLSTSTLHN